MNGGKLKGVWAAALTMILVFAACGDDSTGSSGTDTGTDTGTDAGTDTGTDTGTDAVADAEEDGEGDMAPDMTPDMPVDDVNPEDCTIDSSGATFDNDVLVIESIDFTSSVVVIRNTSNASINFDDTWRLYVNGATGLSLGSARDLASGAEMRIYTTSSGRNDDENTYLNTVTAQLYDCGGEVAVLNNTGGGGWSEDPDYVKAFVAWGARLTDSTGGSATYAGEAAEVGLWSGSGTDDNVATCYAEPHAGVAWCSGGDGNCDTSDIGILATGDGNDPDGWTQVIDEDDHGCLR